MFFQRIKFKRNLVNYLNQDITSISIMEESLTESSGDDKILRSEKYHLLKKFY